MLVQILVHTPGYVWVLLGALILLGIWQARGRQVTPARLFALPLVLLGLGLWSLLGGFADQPWLGLVWLGTLALSVAIFRRLPVRAGAQWLPARGHLYLPGSWLPMVLILAIFSVRYVLGAGTALHPEWRLLPQVQVPLAIFAGLLTGLSLGRALGLLRLVRPAPATIPRHASTASV